MVKYILKRVLYGLLILFLASIFLYFLVRLLPTDFIDKQFEAQLQNGTVKPEQILAIKKLYGLDDNSFGGIIKGYFQWMGNTLRGNLGTSFKYKMPVAKAIGQNMWISFTISLVSFIIYFAISIPLGVKSAVNQYGALDYTVTVLTMIGIAIPSFFFSTVLIKVFAVDLGWFPQQGLVSANSTATGIALFGEKIYHCILPITTMVILSIGSLMRYTRTNTLEILNADYIRTARAKGLSERSVIYKHVFRNTMIPLVTLMAGTLPGLFGGAMITEQVYSIPGVGLMAYNALKEGDIPFIMGYYMFLAILTIIGTLLTDIAYVLVDPRVKLK